MKVLLVSVLFIAFPLYGQTVNAFRNAQNGHFSLSSSSCEVVREEARALAQWTQRIHEQVTPAQIEREGNFCFLDVSGVSPSLVNERFGRFARTDGPNCFNTALAGAKVLPHLRFTKDNELEFWLTSPLCTRIERSGLTPGDVISIRNDQGNHVHSFNYISERLAFSKDGLDLSHIYGLRTPEAVINSYHQPVYCGTVCHEEYYHCVPIEDYLTAHPLQTPELKETWDATNALECRISDVATGSTPLTADLLSLINVSLASLEELSRSRSSNGSSDHFFWQALELKLGSLRQQITYFHH